MRTRNTRCLIAALLSVTFLLWSSDAPAQKNGSAQQDPNSPRSNAQSLKNLLQVEANLKRNNHKPAHQPVVTPTSEVFLTVDDSYKDQINNRRQQRVHYVLTRLTLVNQSQQPLKLVRSQIKAKVDGTVVPLGDLPEILRYQDVQLSDRTEKLSKLEFKKEVVVPPGQQDSLWLIMPEIQAESRIPEVELETTINGQPLSVNVNRYELGRLDHSVKRMGPSQCLAEIIIQGRLNTINVGGLVQSIDQLAAANIKRFVIYFPKEKPDIDQSVRRWLPRAAELIGTNTIVEPRFPAFPSSISELHLSGEEFKDDKPRYPNLVSTHFAHETEEAAIQAALDSAMQLLPQEKIAEQIRTGSPAIQIAALVSGGRQLTKAELPLILQLSHSQNQKVQLAALYALRNQGAPQALDRLTQVAKTSKGPLFEMAITSLAESRFAQGQQALLQILNQAAPESQIVIIGIIAQSPRPQWSAAIYQFLESENLELRKAAIKALVLNGHPRLFEVLSQALESPHADLRQVAFLELIKRSDSESEALAADYILKELKSTLPTSEMLNFIDRLKEPRAVPLLFSHLRQSKMDSGMRVMTLKTLAAIGDQNVDQAFAEFYPQAVGSEKILILSSLQKLESPQYFKLAKQALNDKDQNVLFGAISSLRTSSTNDAAALLSDRLQQEERPEVWTRIYAALATIGTPEAKRVIMQARYAGDIDEKKQAAHSALSSFYRNSPGGSYYRKGEQLQDKNSWQAAIAEYETAISIDSQLVPAYLGIVDSKTQLKEYDEALKFVDQALAIDDKEPRLYVAKGMIYTRQDQTKAAMEQLQRAIEIDPRNSYAHSILASHYSQLREFDKAIAACDAAIKINPKSLFPYSIKARIYNETEQWDEAIKVYGQMLEQNDRYELGYTSRGHVHLQKSDWKAAQQDFQKAFDLNQRNSQAITGLAICMVYNREEQKAIEFIEDNSKNFARDDLFQYNAACVFGRALINLKDQPVDEALKKTRSKYQEQALTHLTQSYQNGFDDWDWMQRDPDLAELQQLPAFKALVAEIKKGPAKPKP